MLKRLNTAGSWGWLLRHQLRLAVRNMNFGRLWFLLLVGGGLWALVHLLAWMAIGLIDPKSLMQGELLVWSGIGAWMLMSFILSSAILMAVGTLYERGDMDLLLSSPLPVRSIFIVRGLDVAIRAVMLPALFLLPFAHMGAARGHAALLLAYPVMAGIALGCAGLAFGLTLALVRRLGLRRARVVAQVLSALAGLAIFLPSQGGSRFGRAVIEKFNQNLHAGIEQGWLATDSLLWWPARALLGDALPALLVMAVGVLLFVLMTRLTENIFLAGSQEAAASHGGAAPLAGRASFRSGLARLVIVKELRQIGRDPQLMTQVLVQVVYMLPVLFVAYRPGTTLQTAGAALIFSAGVLTSNLAFITVTGEEMPDLLGAAPLTLERLRWYKAFAAMLPATILGLPALAVMGMHAPETAAIFGVLLLAALGSAAVVQVWCGEFSGQRDLKIKQKRNVALNILESLALFGWAGAGYGLTLHSRWGFVGIAVGLLFPLWAWMHRRSAD